MILYFVACVVFMLAVVLKNEELMLISKPVIVPAVFFYYFQEKQRINLIYACIISLFFISDMILLIDPNNFFFAVISLIFVGYLLFFKGIFDDFIRIRFHFVNRMNLLGLMICVFLLIFLHVSLVDIVVESKTEYLWLLIVYGVVLVMIGFVSAWNYSMFPSRYTTFMCLASLSFIISDVFYILKKDSQEIEIFGYLNNFSQVLSYYFLTQYFLLKKK